MKHWITAFYWYTYNLLFIPTRWVEYHNTLTSAKAAGYNFIRLDHLAELVNRKAVVPCPFIILRHDIDTDCKSAKRFCDIEAKLGIEASYFFRNKTWNSNCARYIASFGHEVGYHFEELAVYAKRNHLKEPDKLLKQIPEIRGILENNLEMLAKDIKILSLASHGDFANRLLGINNSVLTTEKAWRERYEILYEAYDKELVAAYQNHVSDKPYPMRFSPCYPQKCIAEKRNFLFLTHPRWWQPNPLGNIAELIIRIKEHLQW